MIIYKYRNCVKKHHKDFLFKTSLYFPKVSELNDPFDSKITFDYKNLSEHELSIYLNRMRAKIHSERGLMNFSRFMELVSKDKQSVSDYLINLESTIINPVIGIFSASSQWDNILMWSHYADNHSGFVVGLDEEKIIGSNLFHNGGLVEYPVSRKFPEIKPSMSDKQVFYKRFFVKSRDWHYEKEYRIVNEFYDPNKSRLIKYPIDAIKEVIIGFKINEKTKIRILKFCFKNKIPVYMTYPKSFEFKITRQRIQI